MHTLAFWTLLADWTRQQQQVLSSGGLRAAHQLQVQSKVVQVGNVVQTLRRTTICGPQLHQRLRVQREPIPGHHTAGEPGGEGRRKRKRGVGRRSHLKLRSSVTSEPREPITRYCLSSWIFSDTQVAFFTSSTCVPELTASNSARQRRHDVRGGGQRAVHGDGRTCTAAR